MATEWIGGIPEDEHNGGPKLDLQGGYQGVMPNVPGSVDFQVETKPTSFQQFRKMMWERKNQVSTSAEDGLASDSASSSHKKSAIFKK